MHQFISKTIIYPCVYNFPHLPRDNSLVCFALPDLSAPRALHYFNNFNDDDDDDDGNDNVGA